MSRRTAFTWLSLLALAGLNACDFDFERMQAQPHFRSYEATSYFEDGTIMQPSPRGTVPYGMQGTRAATVGSTMPAPVDRALIERGQVGFARFCAPCHGVHGDGRTPIAARMTLRAPPSLLSARVRALSATHVHRVIRDGYGLMPSHATHLTAAERWAVVAYLEVLQLSRSVHLSRLPAQARKEAEEWLR